jgi:hypothetical protein
MDPKSVTTFIRKTAKVYKSGSFICKFISVRERGIKSLVKFSDWLTRYSPLNKCSAAAQFEDHYLNGSDISRRYMSILNWPRKISCHDCSVAQEAWIRREFIVRFLLLLLITSSHKKSSKCSKFLTVADFLWDKAPILRDRIKRTPV